jgi:hypothetical protein
MVPQMFGKRGLGEFDGDRQDPGVVNQIQPIVPVIPPIARNAVMHEQNRCPGVVIAWPRGVENQRATGKYRVDIGKRTDGGSLDEARQIGHRPMLGLRMAAMIVVSRELGTRERDRP